MHRCASETVSGRGVDRLDHPEHRRPGEAAAAWRREQPVLNSPTGSSSARHVVHPAVATLGDGQIIAAGGGTTTHQPLSDVELRTPSANTWQRLTPVLQAPSGRPTGAVLRGVLRVAGNVCALLAAKDHVNVFLYDGAMVSDPEGIITAGHENKTARTVAVRQNEAINAPALTAMFRAIIANNRAGGWRALKRQREV
jgi:hypothetical protein